jgi:hypothetical protein
MLARSDQPPHAASRWPGLRDLNGRNSCVQIADGEEALHRIGRLRYQRFVVDQGQPYASADGTDQSLIDPIDELSVNLFVGDRDAISVALRLSWASDVSPADYLSLLRSSLPAEIAREPTIICSRLITSTFHRSDMANLVLIFRRAYEIGVLSGCVHSVLSTLPHRIPLFERFGYRPTGIELDDPIAGPQQVLMLDPRDFEYLEYVGSPFAAVARQLFRQGEGVDACLGR